MIVGTVKELIRHPVKSFTGESVQKTHVMPYGLYGDRSHAYRDLTRPGKYLTITQEQSMCSYRAQFLGPETMDAFPEVFVTDPSGKKMAWDAPELVSKLEDASNRSIAPVQFNPSHVPLGAIEEDHLLLITDASLLQLEKEWGKQLDQRRFRPNIILSLHDDQPFAEQAWYGRQLKIGQHVTIQVNNPCVRCMIITVRPEDSQQDPSLLTHVIKQHNNHFGVYASVLNSGLIQQGDLVYLL